MEINENPPKRIRYIPKKGMNDIWDRTQEIWYDNITVGEYQKVISSMPNCVEACIKVKGYGIDYWLHLNKLQFFFDNACKTLSMMYLFLNLHSFCGTLIN